MVNLKALKRFIVEEHFKMEGFHVIKDLVRPGDWLAKLDLKDAYFLVPNHQKYLQFYWQGDPLPVSVSSIQPVMLPSNFHQNDETGNGFLERERNTSHYLPQRSVSSLQLSRHSKEPGVIYKGRISGTGPADQRQEVPVDTNPGYSIPRGEGIYNSDEGLPPLGEASTDSEGSRLIGLQDYNYSAADSSFCGDDISSEAGNFSSSIVPSTFPTSDKQSSPISCITGVGEAVLSSLNRYVNRSQARAGMVAPSGSELQQHTTNCTSPRFSDGD